MVPFFLACSLDHQLQAPAEESHEGVLALRVVVDDGIPVAGAKVEVLDAPLETDIEGRVEVTGLSPGDIEVRVHAEGASPGHVTVAVEDGQSTEAVVALRALRRVSLANAERGGTVATDDGLQLSFATNSLADANGQPVTGELDIDYALFDSALSLYSAPGSLMAEGEAGEPVQLLSNGMVDVHLSQGGVEVQPTEPVEISFPVLGNEAPCDQEFGLYGFDMATGLWTAEEGGRVVGDRFVANVAHFSYWNCDAPAEGAGCIDVTLLRDGEPMANTEVGVWLSNGTAASPTTDGLGALRVEAPPRDLLTLGIVYDAEGRTGAETADAIWSVGPVTVPVAGEGCADGGSVEVTGVDMDGDGRSVQPWGNECYDHDARHTEPCPGAAGYDPGDGSGAAPAGDTACP